MSGYVFPALAAATGGAGDYAPGAVFRVVFHTTETSADPLLWVPSWRYPSHVVADPKRRTIYQCVPFDEAAKSLYNAPGGSETNKQAAIQVELNMSSPATPEADPLTDDDYRWLGVAVLSPILEWCANVAKSPIDVGMIPPVGVIGGSASDTAPQRMSSGAWDIFDGICSHRHVPENDHWDSGCVDLHRIAAYAAGDLGPATTDPSGEEDDLTPEQATQLQQLHFWIAQGYVPGATVTALRPDLNAVTARLDAIEKRLGGVEGGQIPSAAEIAAELIRQMGAKP